MKDNYREYPAINFVQYIIRLSFQVLSMLSFILVLYYIVTITNGNIFKVFGVIIVFILLNLICKLIYYYFAFRNSDESLHKKFDYGLNNLISTNIGYTCDFKLFNLQKMISRLNGKDYFEVEKDVYVKEMIYSNTVKYMYNEPSVRKYKILFHIYNGISVFEATKNDDVSYRILVIDERDYNQIEKTSLNMYSAYVVYNSNGIILQNFGFLMINSSSHKLDFISKLIFKKFKKNFDLFFSKETYRIIRYINKRII